MKNARYILYLIFLSLSLSLFLCSCGSLESNYYDDYDSEDAQDDVSQIQHNHYYFLYDKNEIIGKVSDCPFEDVSTKKVTSSDFFYDVYFEKGCEGRNVINAWYYDIGTTLPDDAEPVYDKYNLLGTVEKGDIIFEEKGNLGLTGHVAIVEGIFYDERFKTYYVRIIEARSNGLVRSCLDDTRIDDREITVLRVKDATPDIIDYAVEFCIEELGKGYKIDLQKNHDHSQEDWYCSEITWAAYYNEGIDIEVLGEGEPGITPRDILYSEQVYEIDFR
ncbi:MAG: hypothetical protein K6F90_06515 [Lachnospiraceae bacterium]|nr:hypothetical protein [Lachnospiraceae bacterium]